MERQVANLVFFQEEKKFQEETWIWTLYYRKGSKYFEDTRKENQVILVWQKKDKHKKQVVHDKLLMKNNPKLQCFNQNLRNTNFIYYTTSKNKIAEVEKKTTTIERKLEVCNMAMSYTIYKINGTSYSC